MTFNEWIKYKDVNLYQEINKMKLKENCIISESLNYHLKQNISLNENVFRHGSKSHLKLINEVRKLYQENKIILNENDKWIVLSEAGKTGLYKNKVVALDIPKRGGSKKFYVFVNSGNKKDGRVLAKKVSFGDKNLRVKNYDEKRRKSFLARHKCSEKTDKTTPGYWSCHLGKYAKNLGLISSKSW